MAADEGSQEHDTADIFGQVMKNLRLSSERGFLPYVSVSSECGLQPPVSLMIADTTNRKQMQPRIWKAAAECFQIAMLALRTSELPIENLDLFGNITGCSLSCDQIATIMGKVDVSVSFKGLKQLLMSSSNHEVHERESEEMQSSTAGRQYSNGICHFLQLCPALEDLQLHWYKLRNLTDAQLKERRFFDRVAESCRFPSLKQCTLKGIYTSEASLLSVLRQVQLTSFEMEEVHLHSGKFRPVFENLAKMEQLEHVYLDDLWEEQLVYFDEPGEPHFPSSGRCSGPNTITRNGANAHQPIKYRSFRHGYALGSVAAARWRRKKVMLCGPP